MDVEIPEIAELLYYATVTGPDPKRGNEHLIDNAVKAHGLWSFYSGLRMGLQLGAACLGN